MGGIRFNWNNMGWKEALAALAVISVVVGLILVGASHSTASQAKAAVTAPAPEKPMTMAKATDPAMEASRINAFNDLESSNVDKDYYRGVVVKERAVVIKLSDRWHLLSVDRKEALCKGMFTRWFALGGVRGIHEDPTDFHFEFRHEESNRILATWSGLSGVSIARS